MKFPTLSSCSAGNTVKCVELSVGPNTTGGFTVLELREVYEEEFERLPEEMKASWRLDPEVLETELAHAATAAQAAPDVSVPAGAT